MTLSGLILVALIPGICHGQAGGLHPWQPASTNSLASVIRVPAGYQRVAVERNSFGNWLRHLPLKPDGSSVHLFDGRRKPNQSVHQAVVDIDTGARDLQQCADAVIRLRAEYLYFSRQFTNITFNFTSGDPCRFDWWYSGYRPVVSGKLSEISDQGLRLCRNALIGP